MFSYPYVIVMFHFTSNQTHMFFDLKAAFSLSTQSQVIFFALMFITKSVRIRSALTTNLFKFNHFFSECSWFQSHVYFAFQPALEAFFLSIHLMPFEFQFTLHLELFVFLHDVIINLLITVHVLIVNHDYFN